MTNPDLASLRPHALLDCLRLHFKAKSDRQLGYFLGVSAPTICRIRSGSRTVTAEFILAVHEETSMPIPAIRALIPEHQP